MYKAFYIYAAALSITCTVSAKEGGLLTKAPNYKGCFQQSEHDLLSARLISTAILSMDVEACLRQCNPSELAMTGPYSGRIKCYCTTDLSILDRPANICTLSCNFRGDLLCGKRNWSSFIGRNNANYVSVYKADEPILELFGSGESGNREHDSRESYGIEFHPSNPCVHEGFNRQNSPIDSYNEESVPAPETNHAVVNKSPQESSLHASKSDAPPQSDASKSDATKISSQQQIENANPPSPQPLKKSRTESSKPTIVPPFANKVRVVAVGNNANEAGTHSAIKPVRGVDNNIAEESNFISEGSGDSSEPLESNEGIRHGALPPSSGNGPKNKEENDEVSPNNPSDVETSANLPLIIGISVGGTAVIAIGIFALFKRKDKRNRISDPKPVMAFKPDMESGALGNNSTTSRVGGSVLTVSHQAPGTYLSTKNQKIKSYEYFPTSTPPNTPNDEYERRLTASSFVVPVTPSSTPNFQENESIYQVHARRITSSLYSDDAVLHEGPPRDTPKSACGPKPEFTSTPLITISSVSSRDGDGEEEGNIGSYRSVESFVYPQAPQSSPVLPSDLNPGQVLCSNSLMASLEAFKEEEEETYPSEIDPDILTNRINNSCVVAAEDLEEELNRIKHSSHESSTSYFTATSGSGVDAMELGSRLNTLALSSSESSSNSFYSVFEGDDEARYSSMSSRSNLSGVDFSLMWAYEDNASPSSPQQ